MPEIVAFVNRGAATITPAIVDKVLRHLPQWKLEFTQIYEPLFPHLTDQLEFLADAGAHEGCIRARLDLAALRKYRTGLPFLADMARAW